MTSRILLTLSVAAAIALAGAPALAKGGAATKAVKTANDTMSKLLAVDVKAGSTEERKRAAKVTTSLRGFLDVDELGRDALVDHWSKLSADQQKEYLDLLRGLIEANYIKGLRARLRYAVRYTGETEQGEHTVVATEIETKRKGRPITISVDYVLRRDGDVWRAVDVVTDGVGLVENYRAQFNRIISKESFDGLLERMRKKLAAEQQG